MMLYLGHKVQKVSEAKRKQYSRLGHWSYGYNKELDTVIISKDGTLGDIYHVQGINIGFPEKPDDKDIINYGKLMKLQKWDREHDPIPKDLTYPAIESVTSTFTGTRQAKQDQIDAYMKKLFDWHKTYTAKEYKKRDNGVWIFIKGIPIYIPGTYWFGIKWAREIEDYPDFRMIQNELMIFWEACKADDRCFGMQYVKNRRMGASLMAIFEMLETATKFEDKLLGMISKKGDDAEKIFKRFIKAFKRLPSFFRPIWDGTNNPKKKLNLEEPTKRNSVGDSVSIGNGLGTMVEWHTTEGNAMDGDAIFRSLIDEAGKWPKDVPFSKYWRVVKTSHRKGIVITGKAMVVSTVNAMKDGGSEFKTVWDDSNQDERDPNGQTKSGLYRIFIPTRFCLEGMFDEFGFSIVDDPEKFVKTDQGKMIDQGSITFLKNAIASLQDDPEDLNEFMRQNPETIEDAFRDSSNDCAFNLMKIQEQLDHNKHELNDRWKDSANEFIGNDDIDRGNLTWENGERFGSVVWNPDPNGRFYIKKGCHPPKQYRNQYETKNRHGVLAKEPIGGELGAFGIDPYNRTVTSDGRGSSGSIILMLGSHTCDELPRNTMALEYIHRAKKVEYFFEDALMASIYYSIPFLAEQSNDMFLKYIYDNGFRHFSMNNPLKLYKDLNPQEKLYGGAPQQDTKIGDEQFYVTQSYVEDHIGVSRDESERPKGTMGDMPFTRTLHQLKDVDPNKRTKYDAYIAFSLALLGNRKRYKKVERKPVRVVSPFQVYDNSGMISKIA